MITQYNQMKFLFLFAICFIVGQSFPITLKKSPFKLLASRDGRSITFQLGLPQYINPTVNAPDDFVTISLMDSEFTDLVNFEFKELSLVSGSDTDYEINPVDGYVIRASTTGNTNLWNIKVTYPAGTKHIGKVYLGACPKTDSITGQNYDGPCSILQLSGYTDGRGLKFSFYFPMTVIMRGVNSGGQISCQHLCVKGFGNMANGFEQNTYKNEEGMSESAFQSISNPDNYCDSYPGTITRSSNCQKEQNICTDGYNGGTTCLDRINEIHKDFEQNTLCSNLNEEDKTTIQTIGADCCDSQGDMCSLSWKKTGYTFPFESIVKT